MNKKWTRLTRESFRRQQNALHTQLGRAVKATFEKEESFYLPELTLNCRKGCVSMAVPPKSLLTENCRETIKESVRMTDTLLRKNYIYSIVYNFAVISLEGGILMTMATSSSLRNC